MEIAGGGPYRFVLHPNYVAVFLELLSLPMIFGAQVTAASATVANCLLLAIRIRQEEALLARLTEYEEALKGRPRLIPRRPASV
jgi:methyltransferase